MGSGPPKADLCAQSAPLGRMARSEATGLPVRVAQSSGLGGASDRRQVHDSGVHHFSYERMGATVTKIEGSSHVAMISPKEVAEVVMTSVRTCAV